jgi:hypothetical protein
MVLESRPRKRHVGKRGGNQVETKYKLTYQNVVNGELWWIEIEASSPLGAVIKGAEDVKTLQTTGEEWSLYEMCESSDDTTV